MTLLLAVATAIGAAAVGGVYLAFAVMVMPALARLPAADATAAMREINRRAERGAFIGVFIGAALVAVALGVAALFELSDRAGSDESASHALLVIGAVLSFASTVVTVVGNVPLNNRLERDGVPAWKPYLSRWGTLNTVRALLALAAVGVIAAAGSS
jgi:uncharacterized membrane protein